MNAMITNPDKNQQFEFIFDEKRHLKLIEIENKVDKLKQEVPKLIRKAIVSEHESFVDMTNHIFLMHGQKFINICSHD